MPTLSPISNRLAIRSIVQKESTCLESQHHDWSINPTRGQRVEHPGETALDIAKVEPLRSAIWLQRSIAIHTHSPLASFRTKGGACRVATVIERVPAGGVVPPAGT